MNKELSKLMGTPRSDGQFAKTSAATKRPKTANLGNLAPKNLGYGTNGVEVKGGGGGSKGPSQIGRASRDFDNVPVSPVQPGNLAPYNP